MRRMTSFMPNITENATLNKNALFRIILNCVLVGVFLSQKCHASPFNIKFASDKIYPFIRTKKLYQ
jgi:hypothetical protein